MPVRRQTFFGLIMTADHSIHTALIQSQISKPEKTQCINKFKMSGQKRLLGLLETYGNTVKSVLVQSTKNIQDNAPLEAVHLDQLDRLD